MKKKLALLLAAIMLFAAAVPMTVFGSSTSEISYVYTNVGAPKVVSSNPVFNASTEQFIVHNTEVSYYVLKATTEAKINSKFDLTLTNAVWFYEENIRNSMFSAYTGYAIPASWAAVPSYNPAELTYVSSTLSFTGAVVGKNKVPFKLIPAIGDRSKVTIEITGAMATNDELWIPLSFLTLADDAVTVDLTVEKATNSPFTTVKNLGIVNIPTAATVKIASAVEAREYFHLDTITVQEKVYGDLSPNGAGAFALIAPVGYTWIMPKAYHPTNNPDGFFILGEPSGIDGFGTPSPGDLVLNNTSILSINNGSVSNPEKYVVVGRNSAYPMVQGELVEAGRILTVSMPALNRPATGKYAATFYIEGLILAVSDDSVAFNEDVNVIVTDYVCSSFYDSEESDDGKISQANSVVSLPSYGIVSATKTNVVLVAAKRVDYGIVFDRYKAAAPADIYAGLNNQASTAVFISENTPVSWWAHNLTDFTLVDEKGQGLEGRVKIYKVVVNSIQNLPDLATGTYTVGSTGNGRAYDNKFTIANCPIDQDSKGYVRMTFYISAAADFTGGVYLAATGRGIPTTEQLELVQIANIKAPVSITTKTTRVQVGYQVVNVENVTVKEDKAGLLMKGHNLTIRMQAFHQAMGDMWFIDVEGVKTALVAGDGLVGKAYLEGSQVSIPVTRASVKTPIEFTISGLKLYIDRTVPYGKYDFCVGGDAIVDNYTTEVSNQKPGMFRRFGIVAANYVDVATPGELVALSTNVILTVNDKVAIASGVPFDMGVEPYIDAVTSRTMVPVRFLSYALGIEEKNVMWDAVLNKVTIITKDRTVQFFKNSSEMVVNGSVMKMVDKNGVVSSTVIKDDRMYIPFKYIADAFGITVAWKAETKQAFFNPSDAQIADGAVVQTREIEVQ